MKYAISVKQFAVLWYLLFNHNMRRLQVIFAKPIVPTRVASAKVAGSNLSVSNENTVLNLNQIFDDTSEQDDAVSSCSESYCGSDIDADVDEVCNICQTICFAIIYSIKICNVCRSLLQNKTVRREMHSG